MCSTLFRLRAECRNGRETKLKLNVVHREARQIVVVWYDGLNDSDAVLVVGV
jgi:hypothetical protein